MYKEDIKALNDELVEIYKDIHRHPEIAYTEHRTSAIVAEYLEKLGLDVKKNIAITGVTGTLDSGKPGKTIMIRADMDCLRLTEVTGCDYASENQGLMHACGHDSHTAVLLATAKVLSQHKDDFEGKIKFLFQPAEEGKEDDMEETVQAAGYVGPGGSGFMIQEGCLDGVDACIVMHNQPEIPVGQALIPVKDASASSDVFNIEIIGKGGHGAEPENAIDPVPAAAEIIQAIHLIPSREIGCLNKVVFSIGTINTPGSVWNAVAEKVVLSGGFRTFDNSIRAVIRERLNEIAESVAKAHRCTAKVTHYRGYDPCVNNVEISQLLTKKLGEHFGAENIISTEKPSMGSEDAGAYLTEIPGMLYWVGSGPSEYPLHNPHVLPKLEYLPVAVEFQATAAIELLKELNSK